MENTPITGLEDLEKHLQQVLDAPETPLKAKLFDEVELQLNGIVLCSRQHLQLLTDSREQHTPAHPTAATKPHPNPIYLRKGPHHTGQSGDEAAQTYPIHTRSHPCIRGFSHTSIAIASTICEYSRHGRY